MASPKNPLRLWIVLVTLPCLLLFLFLGNTFWWHIPLSNPQVTPFTAVASPDPTPTFLPWGQRTFSGNADAGEFHFTLRLYPNKQGTSLTKIEAFPLETIPCDDQAFLFPASSFATLTGSWDVKPNGSFWANGFTDNGITMTIEGTFEREGQTAHGTWQISTCAKGSWTATHSSASTGSFLHPM